MSAQRAAFPRELLWLALWLLATIGLRPLLNPDEGRYAGVAFEMLRGSALVPTLDGLPYFHKPPLLYVLAQGGMALFGVNEFAVRLAPALLAWGLGAALFLHLRRWHGPAVARLGLAVLASSPLFFVGAQYLNHDMGVAACITVAVLSFVRAVDEPAAVHGGWRLAGWAACALGVLAKGLIGIVLPALVLLPWLLAQGRWRAVLGLLHPAGLALFAALALPWMLWMEHLHPGFFDYFIVEQHFRRYAGAHFNNPQPVWFYFVALPALMLPWSLALWPALRQRGARAALYGWWVLAVLGFFSLPTSKLVGYAMPALAPAAALLALGLAAWAVRRPVPGRRALRAAAGLAAVLCLGTVAVLAWKAPGSQRELGLALREGWRPGDRLAYIDAPYFDLRFYARLAEPAIVVGDWDDPELAHEDNWRKELVDAARFAPEAGRQRLWGWDRVAELRCTPGTLWLATPADQQGRLAPLGEGVQVVRRGRHDVLLRVPGRDCGAGQSGPRPAAPMSAAAAAAATGR